MCVENVHCCVKTITSTFAGEVCKFDTGEGNLFPIVETINVLTEFSQVKIMEQRHQEERQTAAQEFQAALDELEEILQQQPSEQGTAPGLNDGSVSDAQLAQEDEDLAAIDIEAFEDAVADIEQYLAERKQ
jgi:hypothetical protein